MLDTSTEQCKTDNDCAARGGSFAGLKCVERVCVAPEDAGADAADASDAAVDAGPWGCLGNVVFPAPQKPQVAVTVPLIDLISHAGRTDVLARVCAKIDVNCGSPITTTKPDANGLLHLTLSAGFDGFVLLTPLLPDGGQPDPDAGGGPDSGVGQLVIPSLVFFNPPLVDDTLYTTILLLTQDDLMQLSQLEGTTIDPSLGAVFMATNDCNGQASAGVSVALDSTATSTQGFYFQNNLPTLTGTATDSTGYAGFVNAPVGTRTLTGTLQATQQYIGKVSVFSRASMISYTVVAPSP